MELYSFNIVLPVNNLDVLTVSKLSSTHLSFNVIDDIETLSDNIAAIVILVDLVDLVAFHDCESQKAFKHRFNFD